MILGNLHISLTNIGLYLTIGGLLILTLSVLTTNYNKIVSNNWSISQESIYATVHSIVTNQINPTKGQVYFPFIYTLFIFILINNLIGMVRPNFLYHTTEDKFKLTGQGHVNNVSLRLGYLSTINNNILSKFSVKRYSTTSFSNNKDTSSLVLNPYYLTGFIDAEGCFNVSILKNSELVTGWHIRPSFQISLHTKDRAY